MRNVLLLLSAVVCEAAVPELPRVYVDTAYSLPGGSVIKVAAGANLQAALNAAPAGSIIELQPGAVFGGNYTLSQKSGWVYVMTAGCDINPGNRAKPADASKMARIQTNNALPALTTPARASYWRFVCVEIVNSRTTLDVISLIQLQPTDLKTVLTAADYPNHIIFDRCLIHGNPGDRIRRAIRMAGAHFAVIDSSIYDIRLPGFDAQTISGSQGTGPYKIVNNFLEATTENVAFGGSDIRVPDEFPSDIEIRGNHLYKDLAWKDIQSIAGRGLPLFKNCIEFKHGRRILIEANICENNWEQAQAGYAIVMTPTFYADMVNPDGTPAYAIEDVTFRHNKILNSPLAINLMGTGVLTSDGGRSPSRRQSYENNYWQLNGSGGSGRLLQLINNATEVILRNNTFDAPANCLGTAVFMGSTSTELTFQDNVIPWCTYGVYTSSGALNTRVKWEAAFTPGASLDSRFNGNVFIAPKAYLVPPANTFVPSAAYAVGLGANLPAIEAATAKVISGQTYVAPLAR